MLKRYFIVSFFLVYGALRLHAGPDAALFTFTDTLPVTDLTIAYAIEVKSKAKNGVGETYNGGLKTVFVSGNKVRIRQASLMRIQSIFLVPGKNNQQQTVIVKESGADKYKFNLTPAEWQVYNNKYDSAVCVFTQDSTILLGYACRKAIITLADGREIAAFFTREIVHPVFSLADPALRCIPGIVLQYTYQLRQGSITYTAAEVSDKKVEAAVFKIPVAGYKLKKYIPGKPAETVTELLKEEDETP